MRKPRKSRPSTKAARKGRRTKQALKQQAIPQNVPGPLDGIAAELLEAESLPPVIDLCAVIHAGFRKLQAIQQQCPDWHNQVYIERH